MENKLISMSTEDRKKLVSKNLARLNSSANFYSDKRDEWEKCYDVYNALKEAEADDGEPDIFIPLAYGLVEDALARIVVPTLQKLSVNVKPKKSKHLAAAQKWFNACRDYFGRADYRLGRISSGREYVVTGAAWEFYEWRNNWRTGKLWSTVPKQEPAEYETNIGKLWRKVKTMVGYDAMEEKTHKFPEHIGFHTRFVSVFNVFPEPGATDVDSMNWVIEVEPSVAISELKKATFIDPMTEEDKPVYDFSEMEKDYVDMDKVRPVSVSTGSDKKAAEISGGEGTESDESDEPSVHIMRIYHKGMNSVTTIAQGKYVIAHVVDAYHNPELPCQLKVYTSSKENLFGRGILAPLLDLLLEVNDIHNLSMQNWIRIINKMVVYDESVIKYKDDFRPRAGGKIRAKLAPGGRVADAFAAVDHADVTGSMLTMESNTRGLIERTASISDLSPGVEGTKQYHSTYGGLMEIQSSLARRFTIMMMTELSYIQRQMEKMYWFYEQFMFTPITVGVTDGGVYRAEEYSRDDFDTGGEGFLYVQSEDPSFGDSAVQRNQLMVLMDLAIKYENARRAYNKPSMKRVAIDEIMKLNLEAFGYQDTSKLLVYEDNVVDPAYEYSMILQGVAPKVNPREDLLGHAIAHVTQRNAPELLQAIASGRVQPDVLKMLDQHIADTLGMVQSMVSNIDEAAKIKNAQDKASNPTEAAQNTAQAGGTLPPAPAIGQGTGVGNALA